VVSDDRELGKRGVFLGTLRIVLAFNFVRFALSFVPRFEGTAEAPGLADRIFRFSVAGFRIDFVWLIVSTVLIAVALVVLLTDRETRSETVNDSVFSLFWIMAFLVYIFRALATGVLDFG